MNPATYPPWRAVSLDAANSSGYRVLLEFGVGVTIEGVGMAIPRDSKGLDITADAVTIETGP